MNNEPVAWMYRIKDTDNRWELTWNKPTTEDLFDVEPLYTQEQLEEARKLGMQQERALWNLSESTQEIMNTHPHSEESVKVKELTDEEIVETVKDHFIGAIKVGIVLDFARAILRKAQEK